MKNILANVVVVFLMTQPVLAASPAVAPGQFDKKLPAATASGTQTAQSSAQATSVLERFRTYSGPRTPGALAALFTDPVTATVRQHPTVALADGATMVRITIDAGSSESISPNVALNEAQLISLKHSKADKWAIEALPAAGTWNASLILLTGSDSKTVPLTVAPRLPAGTDLSEKGFVAFLGGTKTSARPLLDLNGDGRRDYLDDYIFTANYLVGPSTAATVHDADQVADTQPRAPEQILEQLVQETVQPTESQIPDSTQGTYSQAPGPGRVSNPQTSPSVQGSPFPASTSDQVSVPATPTTGSASGLQDSTSIPSFSASDATAGQTPYQRNLSIRNQRAREQSERLRGKAPVSATQPVAPPVKEMKLEPHGDTAYSS